MGKKTWTYANATGTIQGDMICTHCRQPITEGDFRYRESPEAYHPQHRGCSEGDPEWARRDARNAKLRRRAEALSADLSAFMTKWNLSAEDLQDIAQEMIEE